MKKLSLVILSVFWLIQMSAQDVADQTSTEFVHAVYFWLKDEVTAAQKAQFVEGISKLREIRSVKRLHVGRPANVQRPVVDNSYDIALIVYFANRAGHDLYQEDPIHTDLLKNTSDLVREVRIFDSVSD